MAMSKCRTVYDIIRQSDKQLIHNICIPVTSVFDMQLNYVMYSTRLLMKPNVSLLHALMIHLSSSYLLHSPMARF